MTVGWHPTKHGAEYAASHYRRRGHSTKLEREGSGWTVRLGEPEPWTPPVPSGWLSYFKARLTQRW